MKSFLAKGVVVISLCILSAPALVSAQSPQPLTNASVIKLARAGFKEKTIIAIIHSRPNKFDLNPDRLIELKRSGVTEHTILAMLAQDESPFSVSDDWGDDRFFKDGKRQPIPNTGDKEPGSGDIFGSGGSSKGQTRGRGMNGANEDDTVTTGSATVRILRPPKEEGGGPPVKLEKTATLDNDSIVALVEAGFSEGTIIKRIEESPAEFDLSAAKVTDLKKHRVSDAIITAMKAASDDSGKPNSPTKPEEK